MKRTAASINTIIDYLPVILTSLLTYVIPKNAEKHTKMLKKNVYWILRVPMYRNWQVRDIVEIIPKY